MLSESCFVVFFITGGNHLLGASCGNVNLGARAQRADRQRIERTAEADVAVRRCRSLLAFLAGRRGDGDKLVILDNRLARKFYVRTSAAALPGNIYRHQ